MPSLKKPPVDSSWYQQAAEMMVREGKSFFQAAILLGHPILRDQATDVENTKTFQKILWSERDKFFNDVANQPSRNKGSALGFMWLLVHKLYEEGAYDKALEGILKMAKVEGWVGSDTNVNMALGVSSQDLAEARKKLADMLPSLPNTVQARSDKLD